MTSGMVPAGGVPTITDSWRTSPRARNVNVAVPAAPLVRSNTAVREPAGIVTEPVTLAILELLLVTETDVSAAAGDERRRRLTVECCARGTNTLPSVGGVSVTKPTGFVT